MKKKRRTRKIILVIAVSAIVVWWFSFPSVLFKKPVSYVIEDRDGSLLGATIAGDGQWRFPEMKNVPEKFVKCITAYEDKRFFYHPGIDPAAVVRSVMHNFSGSANRQGASTLTMQVMRLSDGKNKRSIWQKIKESIQAVRLECTYSKKRILALYVSHAPFGGNIVGLDAAAWRYYGRKPADLSWGEMAALAVLPNSPAMVHPGKNRVTLERKRNSLLTKLLREKVIDSTTWELSKSEPLPDRPLALPQYAPHLLQRFILASKNKTPAIGNTTIDLALQKKVLEIVQQHHLVLKGNGIHNLCAMVMEVETGNVLAYVGNIESDNSDDESYVDVIKAPRSPGSALKPILYAAAMSDGQLLPDMLLPDVPTQIGGYTPQNFDRQFDGAVPASQALSRSLNIPAVKILQQYKYERFYDLLKRLGITTLNRPAGHYGLSMILGGGEVSLWDLTGVYAGLARSLNHAAQNNGQVLKEDFFPPSFLKDERKTEKRNRDILPALDATSVWFAFQSMKELMRPGEEGLWEQFTSSKQIAWKTGTSFGFRDAWAVGASAGYVVGVWAGNTTGEGRPELLGVKSAAPVMFEIFRSLPDAKAFSTPAQKFSFLPICRQSGFRSGSFCTDVDTLMMPPNAGRSPVCPYHRLVHLDPDQKYRVTSDCVPVSQMVRKGWFVLPPTMEWYYRQHHPEYEPLPPFMKGCEEEGLARMEIVYPTENSKIYVPLELDGQRGKMICIVTHRDASRVFWHLDNEYIGSTDQFHRMAISPGAGKHTLTVVDDSGERVVRKFEIMDATKKSVE